MTSEQLRNLQRLGQLDAVPFSAELLERLLGVAVSRLRDAKRTENSLETRFDCAYMTIRSVADAALLKKGFRTPTSRPGHHQTTLQCLVHTLGVDPSTVRVLDALRKQRNLSDYDGEAITQGSLQECLSQAEALLTLANRILRRD